MDSWAFAGNIVYTLVSVLLLIKIWRRDVYFAVFFSMLVLYSIVPMWGYFFYPELSQIMLDMYFGVAALGYATAFTTLSMISLYLGFRYIYIPITTPIRFRINRSKAMPGLGLIIVALFVCALAIGFYSYAGVLSYSNASDDVFLASVSVGYKSFIMLFKFSIFVNLCLYAIARSGELRSRFDRVVLLNLVWASFVLFVLITVLVGSRTDPLAMVLGIVAYEYYYRRFVIGRVVASNHSNSTSSRWWTFLKIVAILSLTVGALTVLKNFRDGGSIGSNNLEISTVAQAIFHNDYYWPFHVLIGAIFYNYIDPGVVIASNFGNSLMFLGVDYLQFFIVEQWASGYVTRTASPALYPFTEGFVMLGWFGFIYNGIVWALGLSLWRLLSRSNDEKFNALAFAITIAVAATVARTQSSYFIKDSYLWFLPILALYAIATGVRPKRRRVSSRLVPPAK